MGDIKGDHRGHSRICLHSIFMEFLLVMPTLMLHIYKIELSSAETEAALREVSSARMFSRTAVFYGKIQRGHFRLWLNSKYSDPRLGTYVEGLIIPTKEGCVVVLCFSLLYDILLGAPALLGAGYIALASATNLSLGWIAVAECFVLAYFGWGLWRFRRKILRNLRSVLLFGDEAVK